MSRGALRAVLVVLGAGAMALGGVSVLFGAEVIAERGTATPSLDSELRFYASWYVVAGALLLAGSRRPERATAVVWAVSGGFLLAAVGRALSWASLGRPAPLYVGLLVAEVVIPAVLVPWQWRVARASPPAGSG